MSVQGPPCYHCDRYRGNGRCEAFPGGIPLPVFDGEVDHRQPVDGDGGLLFLPTAAFEPHAVAYFDAWVFGPRPEPEPGVIL